MIQRLFVFLGLLILVGCGGNEVLPTAVPTAFFPQNTDSQGNNSLPEAVPTGELAPLPPLSGVAGGGGLSGGSAPGSLPADGAAAAIVIADPFAQTTFTLNAALPTEPATAAALRQTPTGELTAEAARQLAQRFGFSGEMYQENSLASGDTAVTRPTIYYTFDGSRTFSIDPWSANYQDNSAPYDPANPPDFASASQTAVQFLESRGLLDFPYLVRPGFGGDVLVLRQVEGKPLNQPEIVIGVSPEGVVSYVSYQVMSNLETVGDYPLIPATEAWARLQSGVTANNIASTVYPAAGTAVPNPLSTARSWQRPYAPGQTVQLYGWPNAFLPASGSGAARVQLYPYQLAGNEEVINQMAAAAGQQIMVEGVMGDDGRTVTVNNWSPTSQEPLTWQGIVRREGDRVLFDTDDRQTFQLPDAPSDLPDGLELFVFAWNSQPAADGPPLLQWERLDEAMPSAALAADDTGGLVEMEPPAYESVTIGTVELAYFVTYLFAEGGIPSAPTILLQPAWRFAGTLNSGEMVEFFVQAVVGN
ncbi:MAG: hypothetical protein BroJett015_35520 [Chloroflexota bacterium]|nr:hypothetical protein [Ardenticatenaceae bacterium]GIK57889.1 MAG: hypothetical protein BroJett015_35520 [Chloroflexota bacterium]